jgi:hypothetical protein
MDDGLGFKGLTVNGPFAASSLCEKLNLLLGD